MSRSPAGGVLLVLLALAAAGCGDEQSPEASGDDSETPSVTKPADPTSTAIPTPKPDCSEVWVEGADLPGRYSGCTDENGSSVRPKTLPCESGQLLVMYGGHYYAVPGHRVNRTAKPLRTDPDFAQVLARCTG